MSTIDMRKRLVVAQPNVLILWSSGGELRSCNTDGFRACSDDLAPRFSLAPVVAGETGSWVDHELTFYGSVAPGREQANVKIAPGTARGEYRMKMTVPDLPNQTPQQALTVHLGPAN